MTALEFIDSVFSRYLLVGLLSTITHVATLALLIERFRTDILAACRKAMTQGKQDADFFRIDQRFSAASAINPTVCPADLARPSTEPLISFMSRAKPLILSFRVVCA